MIPVQRHVSHSFFLCTKDGYSIWIQTATKCQMREVYTYIQLNGYWYPPRKTGALRRSRPLLPAPNFSNLFSRAASNEGRLADGLSKENCFFFATSGLTGTHLFLLFPGLDADRLQQGRPSLSCFSTCCTSFTSTTSEMRTVVRGAASPQADDATVSALNKRSRKPLTAFLRDTFFSRYDFRSAITGPVSTPIASQGSNLELFRTASAAVIAVFSMLTPVAEKKFLRDQTMTHKILHTCHCPLHFLMTDWDPIERHSKDGMQLWRTLHH